MPRRLFLALLIAFTSSATTPARSAEPITVAVAISLKDAMESVATSYREATRNEVRFQFGSSGQLLAQAKAGAPIDLFISAADKQIDDAIAEGLAVKESRRVIAGNALVLIIPADSKAPIRSFTDLADPGVTRLAVGEPRTVPAGEYAVQTLASLGLIEMLRPRLVYGTNVRQVLDYVKRGEVSAGIVYTTDAMEAGGSIKVVATADPRLHKPIAYPAILVRASKKQIDAQRFLDYLASPKAQQILRSKGFLPKHDEPRMNADDADRWTGH